MQPAIASLVEKTNGALKRVPVLPLYFVALVPAALLIWRAVLNELGADPMRALEQGLGFWALRFMIAVLIVTPLRELSGLNLLRFRRMLGLTVFYYVIVHLSVYLALDRQFDLAAILGDIAKRPYIVFGMSAFLMLIPLAVTSHDAMVRRMGALAWRKLHRLAYPAAVLMVLHYMWLLKTWTLEPITYAAIVTALLVWRLVPFLRGPRGAQARARPARA